MTQHATLSPSGAHRWLACAAAPFMERGRPDEASAFAAEGTAAHEAAAIALLTETPVQPRAGINADDIPAVQEYADYVAALAKIPGARAFVEQPLDIAPFTGETGAKGTADAVVITPEEIIVVDFKFGRGVRVDAANNPQLLLYAAAAQQQFDAAARPARLVVHQPRIAHVSEWRCQPEEMLAFLARVRRASAAARDVLARDEARASDYAPGEDACRFCRARAVCPALADKVQRETGADFAALDASAPAAPADAEALARALPHVPLIEAWCRAVTAEAERLLLAGTPIAGYKMVQGRAGARIWADAQQAEEMLRAMRIKAEDMYERKLISPPAAEKLAKAGAIGKRQWPRLQQLITRRDAKPCLAPASDPRPALSAADEFDVVQEG